MDSNEDLPQWFAFQFLLPFAPLLVAAFMRAVAEARKGGRGLEPSIARDPWPFAPELPFFTLVFGAAQFINYHSVVSVLREDDSPPPATIEVVVMVLGFAVVVSLLLLGLVYLEKEERVLTERSKIRIGRSLVLLTVLTIMSGLSIQYTFAGLSGTQLAAERAQVMVTGVKSSHDDSTRRWELSLGIRDHTHSIAIMFSELRLEMGSQDPVLSCNGSTLPVSLEYVSTDAGGELIVSIQAHQAAGNPDAECSLRDVHLNVAYVSKKEPSLRRHQLLDFPIVILPFAGTQRDGGVGPK